MLVFPCPAQAAGAVKGVTHCGQRGLRVFRRAFSLRDNGFPQLRTRAKQPGFPRILIRFNLVHQNF